MAALFVVATLGAQREIRRIDEMALSIARNASPSIVVLAGARGRLRKLEHALTENDPATVKRLRGELDRALQVYFALPEFPGERAHMQASARRIGTLDERIERYQTRVSPFRQHL